jgi:hypothetical protein
MKYSFARICCEVEAAKETIAKSDEVAPCGYCADAPKNPMIWFLMQ